MQTTTKTFEPATTEDQAAVLEKAHEPLTDWPQQQDQETETNNAARDYYLNEILLQNFLN